ncbi:MAG: hypothetical protein ACI8S6_001251 [Myxococcota bacterium]
MPLRAASVEEILVLIVVDDNDREHREDPSEREAT